MTDTTTTAVVPSCSADAIQAERDAIVRAAVAVEELLSKTPEGFPSMTLRVRGRDEPFSVALVTFDADVAAWNRMLHESGLWTFMDATARKQWVESIEPNKYGPQKPVPVFTVQAAEDMAREIHSKRGAMVSRGVAELFRKLSPDFKRNEVGKFNNRFVIRLLATPWRHGGLSANHHTCSELDDLARFLFVVRGLPQPDHRQGAYYAVSEATRGATPADIEMDWWTIRLFKNGNGHLTFKHSEDVDRLNRLLAVAGRGQVPDTERKRQW